MRTERNEKKAGLMNGLRRSIVALLSVAMLLGMIPAAALPAQAASWMDPCLQQMQEWGVMVGDGSGSLHPERRITRAEFVTMMNRAFGYQEVGPNPFSDVPEHAWYREDIGIAHKTGYFAGTSSTTAAPNSPVTREQAVTMLGNSLRIKSDPGVGTQFSDSTRISNWARISARGAAAMGIISGYPDGSFRPQEPITRGQTACILSKAIGTRIDKPGTQSLGGVYGNLTITSPDVVLKNTTITGNLYLTGGIGLESMVLENVTVMGKIVICGTGTSQKGQSSVILRNVTADSMDVDSLQGQFLSVRAEGLTYIPETTVRTSAFIEDVTGENLGLKLIQMENGIKDMELSLAGNIKEVINRSPNSTLIIANGSAQKVTIDEQAVDAQLRVDRFVTVQETNLDRPTTVTGGGNLSHVNINAPDTKVEMLPDTIVVRPGIEANINKENMDSAAAAESSEDPRILSGFPLMRDVSPRGADAVFSTNKKGTVRWALTALTDGSVGEKELLSPQDYTNKIIKSGTVDVKSARTEITAKLSGLTKDGSYYVSAMLTDNRGRNSQVKIAAFTTPDDSTPEFAQGYPELIMTQDFDRKIVVQSKVMATKDCRLFYALMPKGAVAPRPEDFKAGAVTGNLGWGQMDVRKNTPHLLPKINNSTLKEQTDYDLYLWLSDVDNGKSSAVKKVPVHTPDLTPPKIQHLTLTDAKATTITMTFALDEPGTFYWAVVKKGQPFYTAPAGAPVPDVDDIKAKIQVENGVGALKKGSVSVPKGMTDVKFNITGLESQTTYDLYFVAKDKAGNYNVYTADLKPPMEIKTLDNEAPTAYQEFTHDGSSNPKDPTPYPDTSIRLVFSENVKGKQDKNGELVYNEFLQLYDEKKTDDLAEALATHIHLYRKPLSGQPVCPDPWDGTAPEPADWLVNYRKAEVKMDVITGEMIITLPFNKVREESGLNLASGVTYYFELEGIVDTSPAANPMVGDRGKVKLPEFTTIDAQMIFSRGSSKGTDTDDNELTFDMSFKVSPVTATSVADEVVWDLLLWSKDQMEIEVYRKNDSEDKWTKLGETNTTTAFGPTAQDPEVGLSLTRELMSQDKDNPSFEQLKKMEEDREYGIIVKKLNGVGDDKREEWSGTVSIDIMAVAGELGSMTNLARTNLTPQSFQTHQAGIYKVKQLGVPEKYTVSCPFRDSKAPFFINGYPTFAPGDSGVAIDVLLNRGQTKYFYVITEVGNIPTTLKDGTPIKKGDNSWDQLPEDGTPFINNIEGNVTLPVPSEITNPTYQGDYVVGHGTTDGSVKRISIVNKLKAETKYIAYFVLQGQSPESTSEKVYAFRFETLAVDRPVLNVSLTSKSAATVAARDKDGKEREADVRYMMIVSGVEGATFNQKMEQYWNTSAEAQYGLTQPDIKKYKAMTLLEAMATPYNRGGRSQGSVFDLFSTQDIQNTMTGVFETATTNGTSIVKVGDVNLTMQNHCQQNVECKDAMKPAKQQYWFVAMGKSPLGSASSFSAGRYMEWPETKFLKVTTLGTAVDTKIVNDYNEALNRAYSGTITLVFDDYLYFNDQGKTKQVVDAQDKMLTDPEKDQYYLSRFLPKGDSNVMVDPKKPEKNREKTDTLIVKFNGVKQNTTISFNGNMCNSQGSIPPRGLALQMKLEKNEEGFYIPTFHITVKDWDATK